MSDVALQCRCGKVTGTICDVTTGLGIRLVCYCHDCQVFAQHLQQESAVLAKYSDALPKPIEILDQYGGTDIFQMPPAKFKIHTGQNHLACIRLTAKGTYRWYTSCCFTPVGNGLTAGVPFIGIIHNFVHPAAMHQQELGSVSAYVNLLSAADPLLEKQLQQQGCRTAPGFAIRPALKLLLKICIWKLKGWHKPSPLFDQQGNPVSQAQVLQKSPDNLS